MRSTAGDNMDELKIRIESEECVYEEWIIEGWNA